MFYLTISSGKYQHSLVCRLSIKRYIKMNVVYMHMCAHKDQRMTLAILLYHSPPYFFETRSLTEPRTVYGGGQQASVILLSLSPTVLRFQTCSRQHLALHFIRFIFILFMWMCLCWVYATFIQIPAEAWRRHQIHPVLELHTGCCEPWNMGLRTVLWSTGRTASASNL